MAPSISVQLYSVRDQLAADRDGTIRRLAAIGFTKVEPFNPGEDPAGFRALIDELGITVPTTHGWGVVGDEPDKVLEGAAQIGVEKLIVPSGIPREDFLTADGVARGADLLNGLAEKAAACGMRLGYHNHWWEIEPKIDGTIALEAMAAQLEPGVFLELDTYWAAVGGADVVELLNRLGGRVEALHVKDGPVVMDEPNVALGQGSMPIATILAANTDALRVIEFDKSAGDVLQEIEDSFGYLTRLES